LSLFFRSLAGYERAISCRTSRLRTCFMLRGLPVCGLCQEGLLGESFCAGCRRSCTASATDQKNHSPCCTGHFQFMLFHRAYSRPKLKICKNLLRLSETDGYVVVNLTVAIPSILLCDEMWTPVLQMIWTRTMLPCHHYCLRRLAPKHWVNISDQRKVSVQPHPCPDPWHSPSLNRSTCMFNSI
jgi:hypothetical protein